MVESELMRGLGDEAQRAVVLALQAAARVPPRLGSSSRLLGNASKLRTSCVVRKWGSSVEGLRYL